MRKNISTLGRISKYVMLSFFLFTTAVHAGDSCNLSEIEVLKKNIIELAESYKGQPDQDFSKQKSLDVLVNQLLALAPQPPVAQRLELLYGPWEQVWGPECKSISNPAFLARVRKDELKYSTLRQSE